jgi:hypothetical protein
MKSSLAREIQQQLLSHLEDNRLRDFEAWFAPTAWSIEDTGDEEAERLVYDIELAFAEYSAGNWSLDHLKSELRKLATATSLSA